MKLGNPKHELRALKAAQKFFEELPSVPKGAITHCSLHWAATQYGWAIMRNNGKQIIPYQAIADMDSSGNHVLIPGMSPLLNARAIPSDAKADVDYCASVRRRNSHGVAVSVSAMYKASPENFGDNPLNEQLVEFICAAAAALCVKYDIDASNPESCYTHAEAAIRDGYFLGDDLDCRWDLAMLRASQEFPEKLKAQAPEVGNHLRLHIRKYKLKILQRENEIPAECLYCDPKTNSSAPDPTNRPRWPKSHPYWPRNAVSSLHF